MLSCRPFGLRIQRALEYMREKKTVAGKTHLSSWDRKETDEPKFKWISSHPI
jgi:hypothetical protein